MKEQTTPVRVLTFLSRLRVRKFPTGFAKMSSDSMACILIKDCYLITKCELKDTKIFLIIEKKMTR